MSNRFRYLGWQLVVLFVVSVLVLSGCGGAAPKPTAIPEEAPPAEAATGPSEADLYATALAGLGGQMTQTAEIPLEQQPAVGDMMSPMPLSGSNGELPAAEGTPAVGHGEVPAEGAPAGGQGEHLTPVPSGGQGQPANGIGDYPWMQTQTSTPVQLFTPIAGYRGTPAPGYPYYPYASNYPSGGGATTYTVQPGDWLYNIARRYGVSVQSILAANPSLGDGSRLNPGMAITIPPQGTYSQLNWYPRYVATSVWYPEYYWSYYYPGSPYPMPTYSPYSPYYPQGAGQNPNQNPNQYNPLNWGQMNWGSIPGYEICGTGISQSPINIETSKAVGNGSAPLNVSFHYQPVDLTLVSSDYNFIANFPPGGYATFNGVNYQLIQGIFHVPGEHQINGHMFDMEVQLLHQSTQGQQLVISIPVQQGMTNSVLNPIWSQLPPPPYNLREIKGFDVTTLIPSDRRAFQYSGSLTMPPCSESVQWIVFAAALEMDRSQLDVYRALYPTGSARLPQPMNNRSVMFGIAE